MYDTLFLKISDVSHFLSVCVCCILYILAHMPVRSGTIAGLLTPSV